MARLVPSVLPVLTLLLIQGFPALADAQDERGTVKVDSLSIYADMSKDSDVVDMLPRGKTVRITYSVTGSDGVWCKVADIDSSEKLGYVDCHGLERQNAPSTAASGSGVLAGASRPIATNQPRTHAQEQWAMAAAAMLGTFNHESLTTLNTGKGAAISKQLLRDWWGISSHDELVATLYGIDNHGYRELYDMLGQKTANAPDEAMKRVASRLDSEDANSLWVAHRTYAQNAGHSLIGWDYSRYINILRWGVTAGYISEKEAWPYVMHAAQIIQGSFNSWSELGQNYLLGREFWSQRQTRIDGAQMQSTYHYLVSNPSSPWNRIPWNLSMTAEPAH